MFKTLTAFFGALALALTMGASSVAAEIRGDYLEARTADVFTGPCFSNAEVFITGDQAVMAWKVNEGQWQGVDLSGLSVAAAVLGSTTFSEDNPELARAVLIVDQTATPEQRDALINLAQTLGGQRLTNVVDVRSARMALTVETHEDAASEAHARHTSMPQAPRALFWAAGVAEILTRPLDHDDHFCGNETVAYPPLSKGVEVLPAYTIGHQFRGEGLGSTWHDRNSRGSFVGHFAY